MDDTETDIMTIDEDGKPITQSVAMAKCEPIQVAIRKNIVIEGVGMRLLSPWLRWKLFTADSSRWRK